MKLLGSILLALCCCSCATILAGPEVKADINSSPPGASIYEGSTFIGTTPYHGTLKRRVNQLLHFQLNGYLPKDTLIIAKTSGAAIFLDILCTAGLGIIVDAWADNLKEIDIPFDDDGLRIYLQEDTSIRPILAQARDTTSIGNELEHLLKLRQEGAINDEEYRQAKAKLLR